MLTGIRKGTGICKFVPVSESVPKIDKPWKIDLQHLSGRYLLYTYLKIQGSRKHDLKGFSWCE
jgi:hypothetical protein